MFGRLSGWELVIILVILLLLFGARKLPDLARSVGESARELRAGFREGTDGEDETEDSSTDAPSAQDASGEDAARDPG
jgi:sec-independent protein translocase protein TatA